MRAKGGSTKTKADAVSFLKLVKCLVYDFTFKECGRKQKEMENKENMKKTEKKKDR